MTVYVRDSMEQDCFGQCEMPVNLKDQNYAQQLSYLLPVFPRRNEVNQKYYPLRPNVPSRLLPM